MKKTVTISVTLSVYLCFNNVWRKHYRLRDSKLAEGRSVSGRLQKKNKNKPRVDYELHSAHGHAVNNINKMLTSSSDKVVSACRLVNKIVFTESGPFQGLKKSLTLSNLIIQSKWLCLLGLSGTS